MESQLKDIIAIQKMLVPELMPIFLRRYEILNTIASKEPIGRRNIALMLGLGEKIIRNEVTQLKAQALIHIKNQGMYITKDGRKALEDAEKCIYYLKALDDTERKLAGMLGIKKVILSSNEAAAQTQAIQATGKKAAKYLKSIISDNLIIGVTGGTTLAATVKEMQAVDYTDKNITVVPARGGLGLNAETQANNIAAVLADKLSCSYKLLHITENLSKELLDSLLEYPDIKETIDYINKINILVFGIGRADIMAHRRNLPKEKIELLFEKGAVAEAFGYYFDKKGKIVDIVNTVGITLERYNNLKHVIGVAAGVEKAQAIMAVSKLNPNLILVIDESLAQAILETEKKDVF